MSVSANLAPPKLSTTLPVSFIAPTSPGPAAEAGIVQINLGDITGQVVTGGEFGLATTMGTPNWSYASYADPTFQALANQYPIDLLRHNWELNTMMDIMFPTRGSASTPDYSHIDTFLNQQGNLKDFFNNQTATQIVTLGFPSWLNIADPADQALYANMVKGIAQHFIAMGEPVNNYELVNEPDGHENVVDMANTFNVVAQALKSVDPSYKLGGLTESWARLDDLKTFFQIAAPNIGFVSWHQYVTGDSSSKSSQQEVNDAMSGVQTDAQSVRAAMQAAGIPDDVPMFLGEYNVDGGNYGDPANGNMVGAIAAAAATYGMIHSNTNMPMGALWDVQNDSAYSVFGSQGNYQIDSVGITLGDLTSYMPGAMAQTTMPSDTPGLVGYTTTDNGLFSTALIDINLSQGYTVDLSKDGLGTTGLYRIEVSPANPQGSKTAITDLSHVSVAAGSLVIISDENPHSGTELNGTTSTATPPPVPPSTPTPAPTPIPTAPPTPSPAPTPTPTPTPAAPTTPATPPVQTQPAPTPAPTPTPAAPATPPVLAQPAPTPTPDVPATPATPPVQTQPASPMVPSTPAGIILSPAPVGTPPTVGTGPDTVVLHLSEDAYNGDAQFVLTVDGKPVGPAQSVTALHNQGQSEAFTLKGDFGPGPHQFGVSYVNDAWGGSAATDRNLYIDSAAFNGSQVLTGVAMIKDGTVPFGAATGTGNAGSAGTTPAPVAIPSPPAAGAGPDTVVLALSEDAYLGDAQFVLTVDGKPVGPAQSVTALHGQGQTEDFTLKGDFGPGPHQFGVSYVNDAWGGTDATDRNLYIDSATYNGGRVENTVMLRTTSTAVFGSAAFVPLTTPEATPTQPAPAAGDVPAPAPAPVVPTASNPGVDSQGVSPPIDTGVAVPPPGQEIGLSAPATTPSATTPTASITPQTLGFGPGTQSMSFASPQDLTITGGPGADTVTATSGTNTFIAGTGTMDITGGSGSSDFILHAGGGKLTIEDFLASKGDAVTVDKALQPNLKQASDGHGGTLLTFGANQGSIDLIGYPSTSQPSITFA